MSVINVQKVFVDLDDELNFIIEKIIKSDSSRVALIVPKNAIVVSSKVSIKLLARSIFTSNKTMIMICEDSFVSRLAAEAGIIVVSKISEINSELWEQAVLNRSKYQDRLKQKERELLKERGIDVSESKSTSSIEEEDMEAIDNAEDKIELEMQLEDLETDDNELEASKDEDKKEAKDEEEPKEIKGAIQRKPLKPKLKTVGGIKIIAGGDIQEFEAEGEDVIVTSNYHDKEMKKDKSKFTGVDLSKIGRKKRKGRERVRSRRNKNPFNKKKWGIIGGLILIVVASVGYFGIYMMPQVEITLTFNTREVPIETEITARVSQESVDLENLVLPAKEVMDDTLNISGTNEATGVGVGGTKATGIMEFWNKTDNEITLAVGTEIESVGTGLKYVIKEEVTLEKQTEDENGIKTVGGAGLEVRVEAAAVGDEYNITESSADPDFTVSGYTTEQVVGKRFRSFTGGESFEFVTVSQEDVDNLTEELEKALEADGLSRIDNLVESGYRVIPNSYEIELTEVTSIPEVGEEAEEFNLSVEAKITVMTVLEEDLIKVASELISRQEGQEDGAELTTLDSLLITDVTRDDAEVSFLINTKGNLRTLIPEEDIKDGIKGMGFAEANTYLNNVDGVERVQFIFTPGWIPESLRIVPMDSSRIQVRFTN